jgi:hypothetical protein
MTAVMVKAPTSETGTANGHTDTTGKARCGIGPGPHE